MVKIKLAGCLVALTAFSVVNASAVAVRGGFNSTTFPGNDDLSVGPVAIGFTLDFFGVAQTQLWVNNNGNVTFGAPLGTFTPFAIQGSANMLAPFFADVDTRPVGSTDVTYGAGTVGGRAAFGVNWLDVGFFANQINPLNSFQLVIVDRSDVGAGDFDFEFNYDQILWETGQASGGDPSGLGGVAARAGWSNGAGTFSELAGSGVNGALLDGNATTGLVNNSQNSGVDGRYLFQVRNGAVLPPTNGVPDGGASLALMGLSVLALAGLRKMHR